MLGAVFGCLVCPPGTSRHGEDDEAVTVEQLTVQNLQRLTRSEPGQCHRDKDHTVVQRREPCPVAAAAAACRALELGQTAFDLVPAVE